MLAYEQRLFATLALIVIGAGAFFRLALYFSGRSIWLDEAALALNILDRSAGGLTHTLSFGQAAPLGFLLTVKAAVLSFGKSELVLRLFPLICGLASLPLFYVSARKVTSQGGALIALLLFASADEFIDYSSQLKQYSGDVTATLALFAIAIPFGALTWRRYGAASLVGSAILWFSHAVIFVLAAIAVAYVTDFVIRREWRDVARVAGVSALWSSSFAAFYFASLRHAHALQSNLGSATGIPGGLTHWFHGFAGDFATTIGLSNGQSLLPQLVRLLVAGLAAVGAGALLRKRFPVALMLGLTIGFAEAAIAIKRYPNFIRTELFIFAVLLLFVGAGIGAILGFLRSNSLRVLAAVALTSCIAGVPVAHAVHHVEHPQVIEEMKPLLQELVRQWRAGDVLYVHYAAQYAFRYYAECGCLDASGATKPPPPLSFATRHRADTNHFSQALASRPPLFVGSTPTGTFEDVLSDVKRLHGRRRVWILYSHWTGAAEQHFLQESLPRFLDRVGIRRAAYKRHRATLLLYDLARR